MGQHAVEGGSTYEAGLMLDREGGLSHLTIRVLRERCKKCRLKTGGNQLELAERLSRYQKQCETREMECKVDRLVGRREVVKRAEMLHIIGFVSRATITAKINGWT